jgi:hypothetical protein
MQLVQPKIITSPVSGNPVRPSLRESKVGDKIYVEAVWIDPSSGTFLQKGIVKILDAATRADVTSEFRKV